MAQNIQLQNLDTNEVYYPVTLVGNVEGLSSELAKLATTESLEEVKSDVSDVKSDVATNKSDISTLKQSVSTVEGDVESIKSTITTHVTQSELQSGLDDLKEEILGDDLTETFDTLKAVQDWADEHGTQYSALVADVATKATKTELNGVKADVEGLQSDIADKADKSDVEELEETLESKLDTSVYTQKIAELENTIKSLTDRIAALENKEYSNVKAVAVN